MNKLTGLLLLFVVCTFSLEDIDGGWNCHHTYDFPTPEGAGLGGCVDEVPSGLGGTIDQYLIHSFAARLGFMVVGGGGHARTCFDVLRVCHEFEPRVCAVGFVLDNGSPLDISIPLYRAVSGVQHIDPYCRGANARLALTASVIGNIKNMYIQWVSHFSLLLNETDENGGNSRTFNAKDQTHFEQLCKSWNGWPGNSTVAQHDASGSSGVSEECLSTNYPSTIE